MTLGTVNSPAANFPRSTSNRRLIDRLIGAAVAHFEEFSSRYKGLIRRKRVYVPEPLGDGEAG